MRITSGIYGGRVLKAPKGQDVRPTADKVRQAIFNILLGMGYPEGADVLDGFCGTGALGLEALSRGARSCVFMDKSAASLQCCRENIAALNAGGRSKVIKADVTRPGQAQKPVGLFFLDPPYRRHLAIPALEALAANGWVAKGALGLLEVEKQATHAIPQTYHLLQQRSYGGTDILFVRYAVPQD